MHLKAPFLASLLASGVVDAYPQYNDCGEPSITPGIGPDGKIAGSPESLNHMRGVIKHFILLVLENRSFDNLFGDLDIEGLSNYRNDGPFCNPFNVSDPSSPKYCGKPKEADSVIPDPDHSKLGNSMEFYGTYTPNNDDIQSGKLKASMQGFITQQINSLGSRLNLSQEQLAADAMDYYPESSIPVMSTLAHEFLVFNKHFSDLPAATNPNRCFLSSGTSQSHLNNDFPVNSMPQPSIFQRLFEMGIDWRGYTHTKDGIEDIFWYEYLWDHNLTDRIHNIEDFFGDVAIGKLPPYSVVTPDCCDVNTQSMHPSGRVSDGEHFVRSIYQALRNSPVWENSALMVTFDESGGFHDHVPNILLPAPDDFLNFTFATQKTPDGTNYTYDFMTSGGRVPAILISPWVPKEYVEQEGRNAAGKIRAYSHTSVLNTMTMFFNFTAFNRRVEDAPTFDHLFLDEMRTDTPTELPEPVLFAPAAA